ncbi:MAG: helicase RepA family protein [Verrucomicrobia bacterium]|nr:helicase RepA family protein [Verrucomicrobiota bacterium]
MIAGPSKSRKTFLLTDLAISVAAGVPWLGFPTTPVPVLYVNLELQPFAFRDRRREIQAVKLSHQRALPLFSWHLRGYGVTLFTIRERLLRFCQQEGIGLIIFDPTYKLNQHGEENAAEPVGRLLNDFEQVGRQTESSVVFGHHFAKGDASAKHSIDRASGSGVWARDPDAILMVSPHQEEDCVVVEMHLRNFAPQPSFVLRWQYPCWQRAPEEDPEALKGAKANKGPTGRQSAVSPEQLAAFMGIPGLETLSKTELATPGREGPRSDLPTIWRKFKELESE